MARQKVTLYPRIQKVLDDFNVTLKSDVESLLTLYEKDTATAGRKGEWLTALCRSAIVLLSANVEYFVENLVCEAISTLGDNRAVAKQYPEKYRLWNFANDVSGRNLSLDKAKDVIELSLKLWSDVRIVEPTELKTDKLKDEFANPTPKNVNWLMGLIGFENYLALKIKVNKNDEVAEKVLGELSQRRNEIAHGNTGQKPTKEDVERLRKFSLNLANKMATDVNRKVETLLKR
jgi:hypothetical protein